MATASARRTGKETPLNHTCSPGFRYGTTCVRCGGLMVGEFCMDLANTAGGLDVETLRCVQCGEVVHPVILQNRKHQQKTITEKASKMSGHSVDGQAVT